MISLTETAARKITQTIQRRGHGIGIRVGVKTTGCSGLAYVLEYVDTVQPDDICIDANNCKLFIVLTLASIATNNLKLYLIFKTIKVASR